MTNTPDNLLNVKDDLEQAISKSSAPFPIKIVDTSKKTKDNIFLLLCTEKKEKNTDPEINIKSKDVDGITQYEAEETKPEIDSSQNIGLDDYEVPPGDEAIAGISFKADSFGGINLLNLAVVEKFQNEGIGKVLKDSLLNIFKAMGIPFITGEYHIHDSTSKLLTEEDKKALKFYLGENGYFFSELKESEFKKQFIENRHLELDQYGIFHLLNPNEAEKFIKPDRIHASSEEKIEYAIKYESLKTLLWFIKTNAASEFTSAVELISNLDAKLPEKDRQNFSIKYEDFEALKFAYKYLEGKIDDLIKKYSLDELRQEVNIYFPES